MQPSARSGWGGAQGTGRAGRIRSAAPLQRRGRMAPGQRQRDFGRQWGPVDTPGRSGASLRRDRARALQRARAAVVETRAPRGAGTRGPPPFLRALSSGGGSAGGRRLPGSRVWAGTAGTNPTDGRGGSASPGRSQPERRHRHSRDEVVVELPLAVGAAQPSRPGSLFHPTAPAQAETVSGTLGLILPGVEVRREDGPDQFVLVGDPEELAKHPPREPPQDVSLEDRGPDLGQSPAGLALNRAGSRQGGAGEPEVGATSSTLRAVGGGRPRTGPSRTPQPVRPNVQASTVLT